MNDKNVEFNNERSDKRVAQFPSRTEVLAIRAKYPIGTRVLLEEMKDSCPVKPGTMGTIDFIDDIGTIHTKWDTGSTLGLIVGIDSFSLLNNKEEETDV